MRRACNLISRAIIDRHRERAIEIENLMHEALETICRLMGAPTPHQKAGLRVFIFRHELGDSRRLKEGELVCWSFYDPDDSKEKVGKTKFPNTRTAAKKFVVVKSFRENGIVGLPVEPVPAGFPEVKRRINPELKYVLAAPIHDRKGLKWGTVNFDAWNDRGVGVLEKKVAHGIIKRLAAHLSELLLK
jgi:hypothetical protein